MRTLRFHDYGNALDGMVERVRDIADRPADFAFDAAPLGGGAIEQLVEITGNPDHVLTISDFEAAQQHGTRVSFGTDTTQRNDILGHYGQLAAEGKFRVPVARVFSLDQWREATQLSMTGHARGKLILQIADPQTGTAR